MTKKQVGKRFLQIIIVLFGISFFTFGLTYLSPGDPAEIMLTECGNLPTPELLEQTRHELGLDQPFLVQYGTWLKGVLTGDMGQSYSFKMPVTDKLVSCFWPTLRMSLLALLMDRAGNVYASMIGHMTANFIAVVRTETHWLDFSVRGDAVAWIFSLMILGAGIVLMWRYLSDRKKQEDKEKE